jgi:radical SAM protein with 4Fe4S-binding SPASM domain
VQISIDGPTAEIHDRIRGKGSFAKADRTISVLADTDLEDLYIVFTPCKENVGSLPHMINYSYEKGASLLYLSILQIIGRAKKNKVQPEETELLNALKVAYRTLLRQDAWIAGSQEKKRKRPFQYVCRVDHVLHVAKSQKQTHCSMGLGTVRINACGDVYPCTILRDEKHVFGNIRNDSFSEIYQKMSEWARPIDVYCIPTCHDCEVRSFCGGGCRAAAYNATGDIRGKDPQCCFIKERILENMWKMEI